MSELRNVRQRLLLACLLYVGASSSSASDLALDAFPGLIHSPSALVPAPGTVELAISRYYPYTGLSLVVQPFEWLTSSIRYISISGREYGQGIDQSYKDKGFDVTLRLLKESSRWPALALGLYDIGGTSLFGSEYFVGSKKFGAWDVSLGLGWGRLGSQSDFTNPLANLSDGFSDRQGFNEQEQEAGRPLEGGEFNVSNLFSGESVAVFGGLRWRPIGSGLSLMIEYESNGYDNALAGPPLLDNEPSARPIFSASRWNAGFRYEIVPGVTAGLSYVRGNTVAGQISFHSMWGSNRRVIREKEYPVWTPIIPEALLQENPVIADDPNEGLNKIQDEMWRRGIYPSAIDVKGRKVHIWYSSNLFRSPSRNAIAIGRLAFPLLQEHYDSLDLTQTQAGSAIATVRIDESIIHEHAIQGVEDASWEKRTGLSSVISGNPRTATFPDLAVHPAWSWGVNPALRSNIGGPTGFYRGDVQLKPYATYQLTDNTSVTGTLAWSMFGNLDDLEPRQSSNLPNVRSDLESYQSMGPPVYIDEIELNTIFTISQDIYGRFSAGIFEEMYAGVGAEILWRPFGRRYAVGFDTSRVRKRDYDQIFGFLDYETTTAHLTLYWNTPWQGVNTQISYGRYLAGDVGATFKLSRRFANGFEVGAFMSQTNVSAADFGEGSFDKGVFMNVPITSLDRNARGIGTVSFNYQFLTRDGAQKVDNGRQLYPLFFVDPVDMYP